MLLVIIKKELTRVFSDRRLVFSAFILPALSIFILYSLMGKMIGNMTDDIQEHTASVVVVGATDSFKEYINQYNDRIAAEKANALTEEQSSTGFSMDVTFQEDGIDVVKERILVGEVDALVVFPEDFNSKVLAFNEGGYPNIDTFYNPSEEYSQSAINQLEYNVLAGFHNVVLSERFGGLESLTAFTINLDNDESKIAEKGKEAGQGLSFMLPMLLNIMLFAGAMGIGIDVIAGEKERGTMATMLLAPVERETIALGKVISLGIVATISAMCTFGAIIASLPNASEFLAAGEEVSLNTLAFEPLHYVMLLVILVVQVGIFVGLICLVSVMAKSVKEAGTYISPIYMVVMISAFATVFTNGDVELYKYTIPILGNVFAVKELFTFDLSLVEFGTTVGISVLIIGILLKLITMAFNNERTMFNS